MGEVTILSGSLDALLNTSSEKVMNVNGDYYLVESDCSVKDRGPLCYSFYGQQGIGKLIGGSIITQDGDAIEGDCLNDIVVQGKVKFMIVNVYNNKKQLV